MSIKRYVASKDTTITNAYRENLIERGTNSNMGESDILEVFSIYGQATTSSLEASRILLQFPIENIIADRTSKKIGVSGNVEFVLKLSNAPHSFSTPSKFDLVVSPLSKSWDEGYGLDMESYRDTGTANWLSASSTSAWNAAGGDTLNQTYKQYFKTGIEDLEINITNLVESWISNSIENNGVLINLTSSQENSSTSFYTKKFFARGSQFFYKRPWIEARTADSIKDNRSNFLISSSLLDSENLNTLVFYNRIRGKLKNIPSILNQNDLYVSLYAGTTKPVLPPLLLHNGDTKIQAGLYKTGIYTASVALNTTSSYLFDVWFSGSSAESTSSIIFATGSIIYTNTHDDLFSSEKPEYVANIKNLKNVYNNTEEAQFRIFIREKNWSPNIYNVSSVESQGIVIDNLFYKITRVQDSYEVIPYGINGKEHTKTSYDYDGNYFNLDMSLFEAEYTYLISLGYKYGDDFYELSEKFKFRVE